jgi:hypothetical protein
VDIPTRNQLERRMSALIADHLDTIAEANPDGFDLGVVALAVEVHYSNPENQLLRRAEGGYTPDMDVSSYWSFYCSDHRWWVQKAAFSEAYSFYESPTSGGGDESDESEEDVG